jgi:hypothetical protein
MMLHFILNTLDKSVRLNDEQEYFNTGRVIIVLQTNLRFQRNSLLLKNVNNYLYTNIYSYLETSGGKRSNLYLNVVHFFNTSVN